MLRGANRQGVKGYLLGLLGVCLENDADSHIIVVLSSQREKRTPNQSQRLPTAGMLRARPSLDLDPSFCRRGPVSDQMPGEVNAQRTHFGHFG